MKRIAYINDPLRTLLMKEFKYVEGFSNREKIAKYIEKLLKQDNYLQFILDHFQFCETDERSAMTRDSAFHFDDKGNFITEDEVRAFLCQPTEVKMNLRDIKEE
jgi:hypothetical protein|tara:strand:- start:2789 stop:3100 length:312 start_codon:yes stop_codon:yes gene_type:complete